MQSYLLNMIEGSHLNLPNGKCIQFNGRIIGCISQSFENGIPKSNLTDRLYHKLCVAPVFLKPLRTRPDDIPALTQLFLRECQGRLGIEEIKLSADAVRSLQKYPWPGNLPELESVVYRLALLCPSTTLEKEDILFEITADRLRSKEIFPAGEAFTNQGVKEFPPPAKQARAASASTIENLMAELSHDLKNPLVAIKTFFQLLPGQINDPEFQSEFFGVVAKSIDRVDYLVERISEFAKFSQPDFAQYRLPPLIHEAINNVDRYRRKNNVDWETTFPEDVPPVFIDSDQVAYCLENILLHIAKQQNEAGKVQLSLHTFPEVMELKI
jgi:signal transduction histidine kinase